MCVRAKLTFVSLSSSFSFLGTFPYLLLKELGNKTSRQKLHNFAILGVSKKAFPFPEIYCIYTSHSHMNLVNRVLLAVVFTRKWNLPPPLRKVTGWRDHNFVFVFSFVCISLLLVSLYLYFSCLYFFAAIERGQN